MTFRVRDTSSSICLNSSVVQSLPYTSKSQEVIQSSSKSVPVYELDFQFHGFYWHLGRKLKKELILEVFENQIFFQSARDLFYDKATFRLRQVKIQSAIGIPHLKN